MFREVIYVTEDYSLRVVDAIVQFHYWLPYLKKNLSEGKIVKIFYPFCKVATFFV